MSSNRDFRYIYIWFETYFSMSCAKAVMEIKVMAAIANIFFINQLF